MHEKPKLSKTPKANFTVQQLPIFNHLEPGGEIGFHLSNIQGGRGLNTKNQKIYTQEKKL